MLAALAFLGVAAVPFVPVESTFFAGRFAAVRAEISPGKKTYFAIDTGSPKTFCDVELAAGWKGPVLQVGDRRLETTSVRSDETQGRLEGLGAVDPSAKMEGLIGNDFLRDKQVLFDPYHGRVSFRTGVSLSKREAESALREADPFQKGREFATLPIERTKDGYVVYRSRFGGKNATLYIDTGCPFFSLNKALSEPMGGTKVLAVTGLGGENPDGLGVWMLPAPQLGPSRLPLQASSDCPFPELDGVVGLSYLARTSIVDERGKAIYYLQPTLPADVLDATLGRIVGIPLWRTSEGRLALDFGPERGIVPSMEEAKIVVSLQGRPIDDVLKLIKEAIEGDSKSFAEVAEIYRSRLKSPRLTVQTKERESTLRFPIFMGLP